MAPQPDQEKRISDLEKGLSDAQKVAVTSDMRTKILERARTWDSYFREMDTAYSAAYDAQQSLLDQISKSIEAARKQEEENRIFVLTLVTAGMAGLAATHFAKGVVSAAGAEATDEAVKSAAELVAKAGEVTQGAAKQQIDTALEKAGIKNTPLPSNGFVPTGIKPKEYGTALLNGFERRREALTSWVDQFEANKAKLTLGQIEKARKMLLEQEYFTKVPSSELQESEKKKLRDRAELALWISWALERDKKHWQNQVALRLYRFSDVHHYEPLKLELIRLGVPKETVSFPGNIKYSRFDIGLDVGKFMEWAASPQSLKLLFGGLPRNKEGMQWVEERWTKTLSKEKRGA